MKIRSFILATLLLVSGTPSYAQMTPGSGPMVPTNSSPGTVPFASANSVPFWAASGNRLSPIAPVADSVFITDGSGIPGWSATLPTAVQGNITILGAVGAGSIDNVPIGQSVPSDGTFVNLTGDFVTVNNLLSLSFLPDQRIPYSSSGIVSSSPLLTFDGSILSSLVQVSTGDLHLNNFGSPSAVDIDTDSSIFTSYKMRLPTTGGLAGQPLLSAGGGTTPMSWGNLSGSGGTFATSTGTPANGCATWSSGNIDTTSLPCGTGTVSAATARQMALYATSGNAVSGLPTTQFGVLNTDSSGTPHITINPSIAGTFTADGFTAVSALTADYVGATSNFASFDGIAGKIIDSTIPLSSVVFEGNDLDFGSPNARVITTTSSAYTLTAGSIVSFVSNFTNTGAATANVNGTGATNIFKRTSSGPQALTGGEMVVGDIILLSFDGTQFQLLNPYVSNVVYSGTDSGTLDTYVVSTNDPTFTLIPNTIVAFKATTSNDGPSTVNVNGLGAKPILAQTTAGQTALIGGEIIAGNNIELSYDGTNFQIITPLASVPVQYYTAADQFTGSANLRNIDTYYAPYFLFDGTMLVFQSNFKNTGATQLNVQGLGAVDLKKQTPSGFAALSGGELTAGNYYTVVYNQGSSTYILLNPSPTTVSSVYYGVDGGTANAHTIAADGYSLTTGAVITTVLTSTNTGATTVNVNGTGVKNLLKPVVVTGPVALTANDLTSGNAIQIMYDGTQFQLISR